MASDICITPTDKARLIKLIDEASFAEAKLDGCLLALERELDRARVVEASEIAGHIITMNSKALLHLNGEEMEVSLVYPPDADVIENKLSVLSPIGTAILGYGAGDAIEWDVPSGKTHITIGQVLYQPEAAGNYSL